MRKSVPAYIAAATLLCLTGACQHYAPNAVMPVVPLRSVSPNANEVQPLNVTGMVWKVVTQKIDDPRTLLASDGSRCTRLLPNYRGIVVGDRVLCDWNVGQTKSADGQSPVKTSPGTP